MKIKRSTYTYFTEKQQWLFGSRYNHVYVMNTDLVILANWWTSSSWLLNSCFTIKSERVSSSSSMRKNFSKFITDVKSWETPKAKQSTKTRSTGAIFAGGDWDDWATVSPREQLCVEPPQDVASTTCCVLYVAIDLRSQSLQSDAHNKSMVKSMLSYISCRSTRVNDIIVLPLKFISDRNFIVQIYSRNRLALQYSVL